MADVTADELELAVKRFDLAFSSEKESRLIERGTVHRSECESAFELDVSRVVAAARRELARLRAPVASEAGHGDCVVSTATGTETEEFTLREEKPARYGPNGQRLDMTPLEVLAAHLEHNEPLCDLPECVGCPRVRAAMVELKRELFRLAAVEEEVITTRDVVTGAARVEELEQADHVLEGQVLALEETIRELDSSCLGPDGDDNGFA